MALHFVKQVSIRDSGRVIAIAASPRDGAWTLAKLAARQPDISEADRAFAGRSINPRLAALRSRLAGCDVGWLQELTLSGYAHGMVEMAIADRFADAVAEAPGQAHRIAGSASELSIAAIENALLRRGENVRSAWPARFARKVRWRLAALCGGLSLAAFLLRTALWPRRIPDSARHGIAVHGEDVNRTTHILRAMREQPAADGVLIMLGRPKAGFRAIERLLRSYGWTGEIVQPCGFSSAMRALRRINGLTRAAPGLLAKAGFTLPFRELVATYFRLYLGAASAVWLERCDTRLETIVFGHTGRADTVMLEQAAQRRGARTVHWVHGLSVGHAYTGISDLAIVQCAHDATWHRALGGYGATASFPAERPEFCADGDLPEMLVLTNFTHYGYTFFKSVGPQHEAELIEIIAELADREKLPREAVTWKPHPVFFQMDPATRKAISMLIADRGFKLWTPDDKDFARAARYQSIVVTPSGVAIDLLKLGRLPVMAHFHEIDADHALAHFSLRGGNAGQLSAALHAAKDIRHAGDCFRAAWDAIGPGRSPQMEEIWAAASRLPAQAR